MGTRVLVWGRILWGFGGKDFLMRRLRFWSDFVGTRRVSGNLDSGASRYNYCYAAWSEDWIGSDCVGENFNS